MSYDRHQDSHERRASSGSRRNDEHDRQRHNGRRPESRVWSDRPESGRYQDDGRTSWSPERQRLGSQHGGEAPRRHEDQRAGPQHGSGRVSSSHRDDYRSSGAHPSFGRSEPGYYPDPSRAPWSQYDQSSDLRQHEGRSQSRGYRGGNQRRSSRDERRPAPYSMSRGPRGRSEAPQPGPSSSMFLRGGRGGRGGQYRARSAPAGVYLSGQRVLEPDSAVTALENQLVLHTKGRLFGDCGILEERDVPRYGDMPGRKGYCSVGQEIVLRTNYLTLTPGPHEVVMHRYNVAFAHALSGPSKPQKRKLVEQLVRADIFNGVAWATDYSEIVITTARLDIPAGGWSGRFMVGGPAVEGQQATESVLPAHVRAAIARNTFRLTLTLEADPAKRAPSLQVLLDTLRSPGAGAFCGGTANLVQQLNIILSKVPSGSSSVAKLGHSHFFGLDEGGATYDSMDLGGGLIALRGYFSSARPMIGRVLVNVQVLSGAFYRPGSVISLLSEYKASVGGFERRPYTVPEVAQIGTFLKHLKVRVEHRSKDQSIVAKTMTIFGIAVEDSRRTTFHLDRDDGFPAGPVTVQDYFRRQHNVDLAHPEADVLNCGTNASPSYIPAELCTVLPGQPHRRLLHPNQTAKMITFAARPANVNAMDIAGEPGNPGKGLRLFGLADVAGGNVDPQATSVKPFGFTVGTDFLTVPGRILPSPSVVYQHGRAPLQKASWNLARQEFVSGGNTGVWKALVLNGDRQPALTADKPGEGNRARNLLFAELDRELRRCGMIVQPRLETLTIQLGPQAVSNDGKIAAAFAQAKAENVSMLLVVLPKADHWLYARIKYHGDITYGIHTINAVGSKLEKPVGRPQYLGNLALKFNVKAGGVSHRIEGIITAPLDNNTMVVGIDVTHPSPGSTDGANSIACVVASTDHQLFHWPGSVRLQGSKKEMVILGLAAMIEERMELWASKHNGSYPDKIVVYRDGVSEAQYKQVLEEELPSFRTAFRSLGIQQARHPKVAIIIVGKRHHTRFYPTRTEDADHWRDRNGNEKGSWSPNPGTIVDRQIVDRTIFEFYLQAHQALQGTARPAHYVLIHDEIGFEANMIQQFTNKLCYLFPRCTKAVSICPPAYLADQLAERCRLYRWPSMMGNDGGLPTANWNSLGVHRDVRDSTWYI